MLCRRPGGERHPDRDRHAPPRCPRPGPPSRPGTCSRITASAVTGSTSLLGDAHLEVAGVQRPHGAGEQRGRQGHRGGRGERGDVGLAAPPVPPRPRARRRSRRPRRRSGSGRNPTGSLSCWSADGRGSGRRSRSTRRRRRSAARPRRSAAARPARRSRPPPDFTATVAAGDRLAEHDDGEQAVALGDVVRMPGVWKSFSAYTGTHISAIAITRKQPGPGRLGQRPAGPASRPGTATTPPAYRSAVVRSAPVAAARPAATARSARAA